MESVGMEYLDPAQIPQHVLKRSNPHILLQPWNGWELSALLLAWGTCVIKQKYIGANKFINLIPNYDTRIARFNTHPQSQPCHWVVPHLQKKTPLLPVGKGEGLDDSLPSPNVACPIILIEWLEDSCWSSIRHPYLRQWGQQLLSAPWHGPQTNTRRYVCMFQRVAVMQT